MKKSKQVQASSNRLNNRYICPKLQTRYIIIKMNTPQKALNVTIKALLSVSIVPSFCQSKYQPVKQQIKTPFFVISEKSDRHLASRFGYGISQLKSQNEILNEAPIENYLKKIQIKVQTLSCICKKRQVEIDVPIRVFRTHYTVTFMPSEHFLAKRYSNQKSGILYERQKDSVLSTFRLKCKHCNHEQIRTFPENGVNYGTVITGCDRCNHIELVSDNLGWIQDDGEKMSKDLNYSKTMVHTMIKKNLRKVGIDSDEEPQ